MKIKLSVEINAGDSLSEVIDKLENIMVRLPAAKFSRSGDLELEFVEVER